MFDQVLRSKISVIDKPEVLAFEVVAERVGWAVNYEKLIPEDFKTFFNQLEIVDGIFEYSSKTDTTQTSLSWENVTNSKVVGC